MKNHAPPSFPIACRAGFRFFWSAAQLSIIEMPLTTGITGGYAWENPNPNGWVPYSPAACRHPFGLS